MSAITLRETLLSEMQYRAQDAIQKCLDGRDYEEGSVAGWCSEIVTGILSWFKTKRTPQFKFIASCMIFSRSSHCVNETQIAFWDRDRDVRITTKWANETMQCIVSIWAFRTRFG